jgi:glutaredoxin
MRIVVYSKPDCVMCEYTKRILHDELHLTYTDIDVTLDRAAERDVKKMAIDGKPVMSLPVVIVSNSKGTQRWAGLKVDRLRALKHGVVVPQSNAETPNG